jgi:hypothetical protein
MHEPIKLHAAPQNPFALGEESGPSMMLSPTKKESASKGVLDEAPSPNKIVDPPSNLRKALSMRDPSDAATERSKAFNAFFGIFFASGGLYFGYGASMLGPLGEKWLKFNFGITEDAVMFLGFTNLAYTIGAGFGSCTSSSLCERFGRVKILFLSEIMMVVVHSFMWVNDIWLFLA